VRSPEGIEAQTAQAIINLETLLAHYGAGLGDVVRMRVHLAHLERDFAAYNAAYAARMPVPYPVRTTVSSDLMGFLIEIDADCHLVPAAEEN
jgi:2-iminobutanoate/2-iminopropanoate deaminase